MSIGEDDTVRWHPRAAGADPVAGGTPHLILFARTGVVVETGEAAAGERDEVDVDMTLAFRAGRDAEPYVDDVISVVEALKNAIIRPTEFAVQVMGCSDPVRPYTGREGTTRRDLTITSPRLLCSVHGNGSRAPWLPTRRSRTLDLGCSARAIETGWCR